MSREPAVLNAGERGIIAVMSAAKAAAAPQSITVTPHKAAGGKIETAYIKGGFIK